MMRRFTLSSVALPLLLCAVGEACAGMINTVPSWSGNSISPLGVPNTATYGQTFTPTAGLGTQLDSFSFWLEGIRGSGTHFSAYVMAWDHVDGHATGPVLYTSPANLLSTNTTAFTEYTFNTGGIELNAGSQYVAFLSVSNYYDGNTLDRMGFISGDPSYTGGAFVYYNNGSNFSELSTNHWDDTGFSGQDSAFQASFSTPSAVPEPSAIAMWSLMAGVFGIGGFRKRFARATTAS